MNYELVLDQLSSILILIIDQNNNIIYPKDKKKQQLIKNICHNFSKIDNCYVYKQQYYKATKKIFNQDQDIYKLIYFENITNYKEIEANYKIDSLTTVLNRKAAMTKIDNFLLTNQQEFSIIMADIDDFKKINDTYGHIMGDIVLKEIGKILNKELNDCIVGRYGGEEFIILKPNTIINDTISQMEKIKDTISKMVITHENKTIDNISISLGIYNTNQAYDNKLKITDFRNQLINYADIALYKSKNNGKNQITIY